MENQKIIEEIQDTVTLMDFKKRDLNILYSITNRKSEHEILNISISNYDLDDKLTLTDTGIITFELLENIEKEIKNDIKKLRNELIDLVNALNKWIEKEVI